MNEGWKSFKISDVAEIVNGGTPKTGIKNFWDGNIPWITPADLGKIKNREVASTPRTISKLGLDKSSAKMFPEDSVILSTRAPIGHLAINKIPMSTNQGCRGIVPSANLNTVYLYYFLSANIELLNELGTGATFRELSTKALASVNIPIPPLREQQQIVALLDEAFEAIDQAKANIEKNIQNAKELFQSKLIEIFTTNDKGWEHKRFQDIAIEFGRGKSKHRPRNDAKLFGGDYPFVQTGDVRNVEKFITKFSQTYNEVGLAQSKLWPKGTICITIAANIAETAILDIEACFPDSIIGLIVDDSKANRDYCFYALQYLKSELQAKGKGSAQDNINLGTFQTQFFPFPEIYTQEKMVKILDDLKDKCILIEDGYKMKLENLDDLKKSILQKAFAGELKLEKVNVA